jgi:hypothetical protein
MQYTVKNNDIILVETGEIVARIIILNVEATRFGIMYGNIAEFSEAEILEYVDTYSGINGIFETAERAIEYALWDMSPRFNIAQILTLVVEFSIGEDFDQLVANRANKTAPRDRLFQNSLCSFGAWTDFHAAELANFDNTRFQGCKNNKDLKMTVAELFDYVHTDAITISVNNRYCPILELINSTHSPDYRAIQIVKAGNEKHLYQNQERSSIRIGDFIITAFNNEGIVSSMPKEIRAPKLAYWGMFEGARHWEVREWDNQDGTSKPKKALVWSLYGGADPVFWGDDI